MSNPIGIHTYVSTILNNMLYLVHISKSKVRVIDGTNKIGIHIYYSSK